LDNLVQNVLDCCIFFADMTLYEGSAAPYAEKRLVVIPDAGHNDLLALGAATYFEAIRDFVLG
jgi:hypothetical protein